MSCSNISDKPMLGCCGAGPQPWNSKLMSACQVTYLFDQTNPAGVRIELDAALAELAAMDIDVVPNLWLRHITDDKRTGGAGRTDVTYEPPLTYFLVTLTSSSAWLSLGGVVVRKFRFRTYQDLVEVSVPRCVELRDFGTYPPTVLERYLDATPMLLMPPAMDETLITDPSIVLQHRYVPNIYEGDDTPATCPAFP